MVWATVLAVASAIVHVDEAKACSCAARGANFLAPRGSVAAPTNTLIWVTRNADDSVSVVDSAGSPVDVTVTELDVAAWVVSPILVLTPTAPLTPGETYGVSSGGAGIGEFTVGDDVDDTAPPIPELVDVERIALRHEGSSCGESTRSVALTYEGDAILVARFDVDALMTDPPGGRIDDVAIDQGSGQRFTWGGPCEPWPFPGDQATVRVGTFDVAGNFSGWGEEEHLMRPAFEDAGSGCTVHAIGTRDRKSWATAAIGFVLLAIWRRSSRARRPTTKRRNETGLAAASTGGG